MANPIRSAMNNNALILILINALFLFAFFCISDTHLDISGDMVENYTWGMAWNLGNNKHPPMFGWIVALWFTFFPTKDWAYYLLSAINFLIAYLFLWQSLLQVFDKNKAIIGIALTMLVLSFNIGHAYRYNANLSELPFITAYLYMFIRCIQSNSKSYYAILGLIAGAVILCKYSAVIPLLAISISVWIFFRPKLSLFIKNLMISGLVVMLVIAPHLYWENLHHWPSISYVSNKFLVSGHLHWGQLILKSIISILYMLSLPLSIFALALLLSNYFSKTEQNLILLQDIKCKKLGLVMFGLSLLGVFSGAFVEHLKVHPTWFVVTYILSGWALVDVLPCNANNHLLALRIRQLTYFFMAGVLIYAISSKFNEDNSFLNPKAVPAFFAKDVTNYYHSHFHQPIPYVAGSFPLAYDVAFYSEDHPKAIYQLDVNGSPWIDAVKFNQADKLIVCGDAGHFRPFGLACLKEVFSNYGKPSEEIIFTYHLEKNSHQPKRLMSFHAMFYHRQKLS